MFEVKKNTNSNKTIRMPDELIEQLQSLADKNDISFNQLVVQCCEYALKHINKFLFIDQLCLFQPHKYQPAFQRLIFPIEVLRKSLLHWNRQAYKKVPAMQFPLQ